jgi:hypothetical protein
MHYIGTALEIGTLRDMGMTINKKHSNVNIGIIILG